MKRTLKRSLARREVRMLRRGLTCAAVMTLLFTSIGCGRCKSESDAKAAARDAVLQYAKNENLNPNNFGDPEVRFQEPENVWMFNYSNKNDRHLLTITVRCDGGVETSRLRDSEGQK